MFYFQHFERRPDTISIHRSEKLDLFSMSQAHTVSLAVCIGSQSFIPSASDSHDINIAMPAIVFAMEMHILHAN